MLLRDFLKSARAQAAPAAALGAAVGGLEGGFVALCKALLGGSLHVTLSAPGAAAALFAVATLRALAQAAAAALESRAVYGWAGGVRRRLLALASGKDFPAHRAPFRDTLVGALGPGLDRLAEGAMAGLRCQGAVLQAAVLLPLLFLFSRQAGLAALGLAVPALLLGRFRARSLDAAARRWRESRATAAADLEDFAEGLEDRVGNGRAAEGAETLSASLLRHESQSRRWEDTRALFPPALEWFFFVLLGGLVWLAFALGAGGASDWLPFGALLLLLYRPLREWARYFPAYKLGDGAWREFLALRSRLETLAPRRPHESSPGGFVELRGVRFGYAPELGPGPRGLAPPERMIFDGLDLRLGAVEATLISGPNGAGKSSLLKLIAGIEAPQEGAVLLPAGIEGCAYLPQRVFVEPDYRRWAASLRAERPADWGALNGALGLEAIRARAGGDRAWSEGLSGGERQRLALGRVFASRAGYLLLDEPTTWLAAGDRERILEELLDFWRGAGPRARGALIVSHEPFLAEFCSRTLRLGAEAPAREGRPA